MRSTTAIALASALFFQAPLPAAEPMKDVDFGHLSACVDDLAQSEAFLSSVFGWRRYDVAGTGKPGALIDADGFMLRLQQPESGECNGVFPSMTFVTPDIAAADAHRAGPAPKRAAPIEMPELTWPAEATRGTVIGLEARAPDASPRPTSVGRAAKPNVDRLALIVRDAEASAAFYTQVLGMRRHPDTVDLSGEANKQSGGIHVVFVDANGIWLALVQPVGPGPLNAYLDSYGDGTIAELIIEVPSVAAFYDRMAAQNVTLVDTSGNPIDAGAKAHVLQPYGDKIAYFPSDVTGGLTIEIVERGPPETSLLERRDRGWRPVRSNEAE